MSPSTLLERSVVIRRPIEEVFDFVADALNDPRWCARVRSCEQTQGYGPAAGAAYRARHNPTLVRTDVRELVITAFDRPSRIGWRQDDRNGTFAIEYFLEPVEGGTRLTQRDHITWAIPQIAAAVVRHVIPMRMRSQFRRLRRILETTPS